MKNRKCALPVFGYFRLKNKNIKMAQRKYNFVIFQNQIV